MIYRIYPPEELIEDVVITLPKSKSLTTRALVLDAFAGGNGLGAAADSVCDDTEVIARALEQHRTAAPGEKLKIDVKASGAALRFLTAFFASQPGTEVEISGIERLCQRPMKPLVDALRACGASIEYLGAEGFAPLAISGRRLNGGEVTIDATVSSQFVSALLMAAPTMSGGLTVNFEGEPVSLPYILMTAGMMEKRGIAVDREPLKIKVEEGTYSILPYEGEGDWSAAAFWYEVSALTAGWLTLDNLKADTLQGDRRAAGYFECLGVTTQPSEEHPAGLDLVPSPEVYGRLDLDLTENPDLAPALAVTCTLIGVPFKFTGLQNLGIKECDRLEAICAEMAKLGRMVEKVRDFGLEWDGRTVPVHSIAPFSSHGDHRIVMALAPIAAYIPGIGIDGAECVTKSYPGYWDDMRRAGFTIEEYVPGEQTGEQTE